MQVYKVVQNGDTQVKYNHLRTVLKYSVNVHSYFWTLICKQFVSAWNKKSERIMCDQVCTAYTTSPIMYVLLCLIGRKYVFSGRSETQFIV